MTLPLTRLSRGRQFLAAWAFAGIALLLTFPMVLTVNYLGEPDNGAILAGYLGSWLLAGGYPAIGSCMSALAKNQVIAFILAVAACFPVHAQRLSAGARCVQPVGAAVVARCGGLAEPADPLRCRQQGRHRPARPAVFRQPDRRLTTATAVAVELKKAE